MQSGTPEYTPHTLSWRRGVPSYKHHHIFTQYYKAKRLIQSHFCAWLEVVVFASVDIEVAEWRGF